MVTSILCPCCDSFLWVTHRDRYESLEEHVSNPNSQPYMKDGYQCPNDDCVANNIGAVWIESGEVFNRPPDGVKNYVAHEVLKRFCPKGITSAKNSWDYYYRKGEMYLREKTRNYRIFKYRVEIKPVLDRNRNYTPFRWKRKVTVWKRVGIGEMIWEPQVLIYKVKKYLRNRRK